MKYLIKGVTIIDENWQNDNPAVDILLENDIIMEIAPRIMCTPETKVIEMSNHFISQGWIDMHAHCYVGLTPLSTKADQVGVTTGVTLLIDAGTVGANHVETFIEQISASKTTIKFFINIAKTGINTRSELVDLTNIDQAALIAAYHKHKDKIVGIKVRLSSSVVGQNGLIPLAKAQVIARELALPIMVHIGNGPPKLVDILALLKPGDIVTHIFNGKDNNIFNGTTKIIAEIIEAKARGIKFDLGHGRDSFSFLTAKMALDQGFELDTISTDIYQENIKQPVISLAAVMTKLLHLGMPLNKCIEAVTKNPQKILDLDITTGLKVGKKANLTCFKISNDPTELVDSLGEIVTSTKNIEVAFCYFGGFFFQKEGEGVK
ncbi:MAG: amidohydrolase/deacetylase family metallohydrolase [Culicoidibacterales bacterium]